MDQHKNQKLNQGFQRLKNDQYGQAAECQVQCKLNWIKINPMIQKLNHEFNSQLEVRLKIIDNFLLITPQHHSTILVQEELNPNVSIQVEKLTNQNFLPTTFNHKIHQISFSSESNGLKFKILPFQSSQLQELYCCLLKYPILEVGFISTFKPIKKVLKTNTSSHFIGMCIENEEEVYIKASSICFLKENFMVQKSLEKELKILKKVNHPSLIKLIRACRSDKSIYIVYENIHFSLENYITQNGFPNQQFKLKIITDMIQLLHYLHQRNIFHQNINASTITIQQQQNQFNIKLSCFENSEILDQQGTDSQDEKSIMIKKDLKGIGLLILCLLSENKLLLQEQHWLEITLQEEMIEEILPQQDSSIKKLIEGLISGKMNCQTGELLNHPYLKS